MNEAANQQRLKDMMLADNQHNVYIPKVHHDLCTRRVLVSEWVDGEKLSDCPSEEIKTLIPDAQEAFLYVSVGMLHAVWVAPYPVPKRDEISSGRLSVCYCVSHHDQ